VLFFLLLVFTVNIFSLNVHSISVKKMFKAVFILIFLNYNNIFIIYICVCVYYYFYMRISNVLYPIFFNVWCIAVSDTRRIQYSYRVRASLVVILLIRIRHVQLLIWIGHVQLLLTIRLVKLKFSWFIASVLLTFYSNPIRLLQSILLSNKLSTWVY